MSTVPEDLNAHLHIENYRDAYARPVLGADELFHARGRERVSLDGEWLFAVDPHEEALRQKWHRMPDLPHTEWTNPPDYTDAGAMRVNVPGCIELYDEKLYYYEGAGWFTKNFDFVPRDGERVMLRVGAAAYRAWVFLNGRFLGVHAGGSTPFCAELPNLRAGRNRLQMLVDYSRRPENVPMNHTDWHNYGGVYRSVELFRLPATAYIADFRAFLVPGKMDAVRFAVRLSEAVDGAARVDAPELGISVSVPVKGGVGTLDVAVEGKNFTLWSPECPALYTVTAAFGADAVRDRVGFREVRVAGEKILLNGKPLWLRGISAHEEYPGLGKAATPGVIRDMLTHARELGCNFMRLAHYPHHEAVAELADELGIMLWEEIPVYWAIDFRSPAVYADAENQLRELIRRDINRASVIAWGVGNENEDSDARFRFMSDLVTAARAEDGTRLVGAACLVSDKTFTIEDRLCASLDIVGVNEYVGWYITDFANLDHLLAHSNPGKPVIITETGAGAVAGFHGDAAGEKFTEEYQAEFYRQQLSRLAKASYIQGITPWVLYDFRSERRINQFQRGYNRKGLIAADHRTKKMAFSVLENFYKGDRQ